MAERCGDGKASYYLGKIMSNAIGIIMLVILMSFAQAIGAIAAVPHVLELITQEEAANPDPEAEYFEVGRGEDDGPVIEVVAPENGRAYSPPVPIIVNFVSKDDSEIDLSTLKVEYLKLLSINITERVRPYVTKDGIKVDKVNIPQGVHKIRFSVSDLKGRKTTVQLIVSIMQW